MCIAAVPGAHAQTTSSVAPPASAAIPTTPNTNPATAAPAPRTPAAPGTRPATALTTASAPAAPGTAPASAQYGTSPQPTPAARERFGEWVRQVVDPENTLDLVVGKPRILVLKQAPQKVQIPDERVAAYDVLSDKELSVTGVAVGTTVLNLWFEDKTAPSGHVLLGYFVRVLPDPESRIRLDKVYQVLEQEINAAFPDSRVTLTTVGNNLIVNGQAKDASEAEKIMRIVESNAVQGKVDVPAERPSTNPAPAVDGKAPPDTGEILGLAHNGISSGGRTRQAGAGGGARGRGNSNIINMLRVPGENQVMLRVTVAEVNRSAARSIGLNFSIINNKGIQVFADQTGGLATFAKSAIMTTANLPMLLDNGQVGVALDALRTLNLAKSLAEPNLVAVNGQTARFQAGGQFPVPVVTGQTSTGLQGVQFIPFGVRLEFTPYITEKDRIRLVFDAEVSTRDASSGATINGTNVPGVNTRNVQTTVDLKSGQTLAVAGLIQQNYGATGNHIPFFGDLPILSSLLGANQTSAAEQELVILINAEMVRPLDAGNVPPLPGHDVLEPNDVEFFLGGQLEARGGSDFRSSTRTDFERLTRYQRLQRTYLCGPSGHSDDRTGQATPHVPPSEQNATVPADHP